MKGLRLLAGGSALAAPDGDAARGRALPLQRQQSGCVLCDGVPGPPSGGARGPALLDLGQRCSRDALFQHTADARRANPDAITPPCLSTEGLRIA